MERGEENRRLVLQELPSDLLEGIYRLLPGDPLLHKVLMRRGCDDFIADRFSIHALAIRGSDECSTEGSSESASRERDGVFGAEKVGGVELKNFVWYSRRGSMRLCIPRQQPLLERLMELFLKRHIQRREEEESFSASVSALPVPSEQTSFARSLGAGGGSMVGGRVHLRLCCCGCSGKCSPRPWREAEGCECRQREGFRRGGGGATHALSELCCPHLCAPLLLQQLAACCYWPCMADDLRNFLIRRSAVNSSSSIEAGPLRDASLAAANKCTWKCRGLSQLLLNADREAYETRLLSSPASQERRQSPTKATPCLATFAGLSAKVSHGSSAWSAPPSSKELRRKREGAACGTRRNREQPTGPITVLRNSQTKHPSGSDSVPSTTDGGTSSSLPSSSASSSRVCLSSEEGSFVKLQVWVKAKTAAMISSQPEGLVAQAPLLAPLRLGQDLFLFEKMHTELDLETSRLHLRLANAVAETALAAAAVKEATLGSLLASHSLHSATSAFAQEPPIITKPHRKGEGRGMPQQPIGNHDQQSTSWLLTDCLNEATCPTIESQTASSSTKTRQQQTGRKAGEAEARLLDSRSVVGSQREILSSSSSSHSCPSRAVAAFLEETARHPLWKTDATVFSSAFSEAAAAAEEAELAAGAAIDAQLRMLEDAPTTSSALPPLFFGSSSSRHGGCLDEWLSTSATPALADSEGRGCTYSPQDRGGEFVSLALGQECPSVVRRVEQLTAAWGTQVAFPASTSTSTSTLASTLASTSALASALGCGEAQFGGLLPSLELARPLSCLVRPLPTTHHDDSAKNDAFLRLDAPTCLSSPNKEPAALHGRDETDGEGLTPDALLTETPEAALVAIERKEISKHAVQTVLDATSSKETLELATCGSRGGGGGKRICAFAFDPLLNSPSIQVISYSLWLTCLYTRADVVCAVVFLGDRLKRLGFWRLLSLLSQVGRGRRCVIHFFSSFLIPRLASVVDYWGHGLGCFASVCTASRPYSSFPSISPFEWLPFLLRGLDEQFKESSLRTPSSQLLFLTLDFLPPLRHVVVLHRRWIGGSRPLRSSVCLGSPGSSCRVGLAEEGMKKQVRCGRAGEAGAAKFVEAEDFSSWRVAGASSKALAAAVGTLLRAARRGEDTITAVDLEIALDLVLGEAGSERVAGPALTGQPQQKSHQLPLALGDAPSETSRFSIFRNENQSPSVSPQPREVWSGAAAPCPFLEMRIRKSSSSFMPSVRASQISTALLCYKAAAVVAGALTRAARKPLATTDFFGSVDGEASLLSCASCAWRMQKCSALKPGSTPFPKGKKCRKLPQTGRSVSTQREANKTVSGPCGGKEEKEEKEEKEADDEEASGHSTVAVASALESTTELRAVEAEAVGAGRSVMSASRLLIRRLLLRTVLNLQASYSSPPPWNSRPRDVLSVKGDSDASSRGEKGALPSGAWLTAASAYELLADSFLLEYADLADARRSSSPVSPPSESEALSLRVHSLSRAGQLLMEGLRYASAVPNTTPCRCEKAAKTQRQSCTDSALNEAANGVSRQRSLKLRRKLCSARRSDARRRQSVEEAATCRHFLGREIGPLCSEDFARASTKSVSVSHPWRSCSLTRCAEEEVGASTEERLSLLSRMRGKLLRCHLSLADLYHGSVSSERLASCGSSVGLTLRHLLLASAFLPALHSGQEGGASIYSSSFDFCPSGGVAEREARSEESAFFAEGGSIDGRSGDVKRLSEAGSLALTVAVCLAIADVLMRVSQLLSVSASSAAAFFEAASRQVRFLPRWCEPLTAKKSLDDVATKGRATASCRCRSSSSFLWKDPWLPLSEALFVPDREALLSRALSFALLAAKIHSTRLPVAVSDGSELSTSESLFKRQIDSRDSRLYRRRVEGGLQCMPLLREASKPSSVAMQASFFGDSRLQNVPPYDSVAMALAEKVKRSLAAAYASFWCLYTSTGRRTRAMILSKQGMELFRGIGDRENETRQAALLCALHLQPLMGRSSNVSHEEHFNGQETSGQELTNCEEALAASAVRLALAEDDLSESQLSLLNQQQAFLREALFNLEITQPPQPSPLSSLSPLCCECLAHRQSRSQRAETAALEVRILLAALSLRRGKQRLAQALAGMPFTQRSSMNGGLNLLASMTQRLHLRLEKNPHFLSSETSDGAALAEQELEDACEELRQAVVCTGEAPCKKLQEKGDAASQVATFLQAMPTFTADWKRQKEKAKGKGKTRQDRRAETAQSTDSDDKMSFSSSFSSKPSMEELLLVFRGMAYSRLALALLAPALISRDSSKQPFGGGSSASSLAGSSSSLAISKRQLFRRVCIALRKVESALELLQPAAVASSMRLPLSFSTPSPATIFGRCVVQEFCGAVLLCSSLNLWLANWTAGKGAVAVRQTENFKTKHHSAAVLQAARLGLLVLAQVYRQLSPPRRPCLLALLESESNKPCDLQKRPLTKEGRRRRLDLVAQLLLSNGEDKVAERKAVRWCASLAALPQSFVSAASLHFRHFAKSTDLKAKQEKCQDGSKLEMRVKTIQKTLDLFVGTAEKEQLGAFGSVAGRLFRLAERLLLSSSSKEEDENEDEDEDEDEDDDEDEEDDNGGTSTGVEAAPTERRGSGLK